MIEGYTLEIDVQPLFRYNKVKLPLYLHILQKNLQALVTVFCIDIYIYIRVVITFVVVLQIYRTISQLVNPANYRYKTLLNHLHRIVTRINVSEYVAFLATKAHQRFKRRIIQGFTGDKWFLGTTNLALPVSHRKTSYLQQHWKLSIYMPGTNNSLQFTCARYLRASQICNARTSDSRAAVRPFSRYSPLRISGQDSKVKERDVQTTIKGQQKQRISEDVSGTQPSVEEEEQGAMSRRLADATEDAILVGGRAGRKAVEEAGFSEELKQKLLDRVESHVFKTENSTAFAEAGLTSNAGRGTRDIAAARAWTGEEDPEDTMLRMLDDARKPLAPGLRGPAKIPSPIVDLRLRPRTKQHPRDRLANARDRTSIYASSKDTQMSKEERDKLRQELKDRFTPGARAMPNSMRGLAALANERIEDAIARGQFKVRWILKIIVVPLC